MRRLCRRPSPAMVVALLALIAATAGTASATGVTASAHHPAPKHADAKQDTKLVAGYLQSHVVPHAALANSATTATTATTALTATTATNATNATHATNADTVGGVAVKSFSFKAAASSTPQTLFDIAGLRLQGSCNGSAATVLTATNDSGATAELEATVVSNAAAVTQITNTIFSAGASASLLGSVTTGQVMISMYRSDGPAVTAHVAFDNNPSFGSFTGCSAGGTAMGA